MVRKPEVRGRGVVHWPLIFPSGFRQEREIGDEGAQRLGWYLNIKDLDQKAVGSILLQESS